MKNPASVSAIALIALSTLFMNPAIAQDRRDRERHERFENRHWVLDGRFHHDHYYPAAGYTVTVLPSGNVGITYRGGRYFYHSGVWFRPSGPGYVVVRPPVGIVVPLLPPGYTTVWIGRRPYYYANDVYYVEGPGGYVVAEPPPEPVPQVAQPQPSAPFPPQAGGAAPAQGGAGTWYYCESAKGYYPYVQECREGWRAVPAAPPR